MTCRQHAFFAAEQHQIQDTIGVQIGGGDVRHAQQARKCFCHTQSIDSVLSIQQQLRLFRISDYDIEQLIAINIADRDAAIPIGTGRTDPVLQQSCRHGAVLECGGLK